MYSDALREHNLEAWVLWDFRGSNPVFWEVLGTEPGHMTRRAVLILRADAEPRLLCSVLDRPSLSEVTVPLDVYTDRHEFVEKLGRFSGRVAMEYSPNNALPIVSFADAGAVELIRSLGADVVSSADLFQQVAAAWDADVLASHRRAVDHVMDLHAFARAHARGSTELGLAKRIEAEITRRGLVTELPLGVSTGRHSGDPHHAPDDTPIDPDAVLLVDLWAREDAPRTQLADITWMTAKDPADEVVNVFQIVKQARDAGLAAATPNIPAFELDRAARAVIEGAGYGHAILHRTGHSLSPGDHVHGLGANLDDTETHDDRRLLPGLGFTVEPGIYLPDFGIRLECNVYMTATGAEVTTPLQDELSTP